MFPIPSGFYKRNFLIPTQLGNTGAWVKSDRLLAISTPDIVDSWTDIATGSPIFSATGTIRPIQVLNIMKGKPVIRFDGVNDSLTGNAASLELYRNLAGSSTFIVVKESLVSGETARRPFYFSGNSAGSLRLTLQISWDSSTLRTYSILARRKDGEAFTQISSSSTDAYTGQNIIFHINCDYTGSIGLMSFYINDDLIGTATFPSGTANTSNTSSVVGFVGSGNAGSYGKFDIPEFIMHKKLITTTERTGLLNYLKYLYR